jgi:hypothetical protein
LSLQLRPGEGLDRQIARATDLGANMISLGILGLLTERCQAFIKDFRTR